MGLAKNEAELRQLANDFRTTLSKVQAIAKEGMAISKKHVSALEKISEEFTAKLQKTGSEKTEAVKAAQKKPLDESYSLDIVEQLHFYMGGVLSSFQTLGDVLEQNEGYWAKDLQAAASAFEKAADKEKDLRKQKWAASYKPPKAGDKIRFGNRKGTVQKVEDRFYGRIVFLKFDDGQEQTWPEHLLAGGDFKFYE